MNFPMRSVVAGETIRKSVIELVEESKRRIQNLTPREVLEKLSEGNTSLIDLREQEELKQSGRIPGSVNAPRGMLEFYADPAMPYYKPEFDQSKFIILYCASGGRSALAAAALQDMGYKHVAHLDGGLKVWKESGGLVVD
jgi:rhodanese-related sulfurtransferase